MTTGAGGDEARYYQDDADEYRRLAYAAELAADAYMGGRLGLEASRDWTPGSPHAEYHRTLAAKTRAGVAFYQRWGWWPEDNYE